MDEVVIAQSDFDAVIFDLDGVITRTAAVHNLAWAEMFNGYLQERAERLGVPFEPFTTADYGEYVDGKPRYDGVRSFLQSRGIELPWGDPTDSADRETVCGLGNRKNEAFLDLVESRGVEPYESSVALVHALHEAGIRTALFSSSRNAAVVLRAAGLGELFEVRVDGTVAAGLGLPGKPDPAFLLEATARLDAAPERTVVVEDALSGVEAGRRGGFGLVIGVDRIGQARALLEQGADVVVSDLAEVTVGTDTRMIPALPSARGHGEQLWTELADGDPAVFLDYDGTLTPIVAHPDMAVLATGMRRALQELAAVTTVAIVSGRDVDDVMAKVGVSGLYYAGSHGFDIKTPSGDTAGTEELDRFALYLPALNAVEQELQTELAGIPGVNVERKRFAVAVHYRQVPEEHHDEVAEIVARLAPRHESLRVTGGKMIREFRPDVDWDKGKALLWLLAEMNLDHEGVVPIYIGDDETDEDAFAVLQDRGVGIVVGEDDRPTYARYRVAAPDEVEGLLRDVRDLVSKRSQ